MNVPPHIEMALRALDARYTTARNRAVVAANGNAVVFYKDDVAEMDAYVEALEKALVEPKWKPIHEAWCRDTEEMAHLVQEHARLTVEGFRLPHERPRVKVETFLGGTSPITGEDYGTNTFMVLYQEE